MYYKQSVPIKTCANPLDYISSTKKGQVYNGFAENS